MFLEFLMIFLFIASFSFWFSIFAVIGKIRFTRWWVWRWWVWFRILWYILFLRFSLCFDNSVGSVSGLGSSVFIPTGVDPKCDIFEIDVFVPIGVESKGGNVLALKFLVLSPDLKLSFIVIIVVWLLLNHSYRCSFTKNMIRRAPMSTIHRPSDSSNGGAEATTFIQCINGQET